MNRRKTRWPEPPQGKCSCGSKINHVQEVGNQAIRICDECGLIVSTTMLRTGRVVRDQPSNNSAKSAERVTMVTMKVSIEKGELVIRIPANVKNPPESASGKTLIVASSHGNQKTGVQVLGKELTIGLNAYIRNE
jgi:hypothetical protein